MTSIMILSMLITLHNYDDNNVFISTEEIAYTSAQEYIWVDIDEYLASLDNEI